MYQTARVCLLCSILATGCASASRPPPPPAPPVAALQSVRAASSKNFVNAAFEVVREVDLDAVRAGVASWSEACGEMQLANGEWVTTTCNTLPKMATSTAVQRKINLRSGTAIPADVDLRGTLDGPVKNQGMVGVCWSMALSSVMDNGLRRQGVNDVVTPLHLISSGAWGELWRKGKTEPMVSSATWPYDPAQACELSSGSKGCGAAYHVTPGSWRSDPVLSTQVVAANARGMYQVTKVETINPPTFEAIADDLAGGQEVWASFRIDRRAWGAPHGGVLDDYTTEERGPHAVTLVGYTTHGPRGRELLIKNSWGAGWGAGGYAWVSERALHDHGGEFFGVEVGVVGNAAPLPITPMMPWPAISLPVPLPAVTVPPLALPGVPP